MAFGLKYEIVGVAAMRSLTQSGFLDPGRVESGEEKQTMG